MIFFLPFYVSESCLDLILIFVRMSDIRLITTSLPCHRCFHANDHWCWVIVTFQVQGTITMWSILTQNLSEQKIPNLLSKLFCLLLFQRLLIQMMFLDYMWALNLLSNSPDLITQLFPGIQMLYPIRKPHRIVQALNSKFLLVQNAYLKALFRKH